MSQAFVLYAQSACTDNVAISSICVCCESMYTRVVVIIGRLSYDLSVTQIELWRLPSASVRQQGQSLTTQSAPVVLVNTNINYFCIIYGLPLCIILVGFHISSIFCGVKRNIEVKVEVFSFPLSVVLSVECADRLLFRVLPH